MKAELQAIKDKGAEVPRDAEACRTMSDAYVAANPTEFEGHEGKSIEDLAKATDVFRDAGMDEEVQRIETWLLHRFRPQNIGGTYQAEIRIVGE